VLEALADLDACVTVVAGAAELSTAEGALPANAQVAGPALLSSLLPTCSALVTCGEIPGLLAAILCAVPALVLPQVTEQAPRARMLARTGAGLALAPSEIDPAAIRTAAERLLADGEYLLPLRQMRSELLSQPSYGEIVPEIGKLLGL